MNWGNSNGSIPTMSGYLHTLEGRNCGLKLCNFASPLYQHWTVHQSKNLANCFLCLKAESEPWWSSSTCYCRLAQWTCRGFSCHRPLSLQDSFLCQRIVRFLAKNRQLLTSIQVRGEKSKRLEIDFTLQAWRFQYSSGSPMKSSSEHHQKMILPQFTYLCWSHLFVFSQT